MNVVLTQTYTHTHTHKHMHTPYTDTDTQTHTPQTLPGPIHRNGLEPPVSALGLQHQLPLRGALLPGSGVGEA